MTKFQELTRCAMLLALVECTARLAFRDNWKERKLTKEFDSIIYILSSTQVLPPLQDVNDCNTGALHVRHSSGKQYFFKMVICIYSMDN